MKKIILFTIAMFCVLIVSGGYVFASNVYSVSDILQSDMLKYRGASSGAVKSYVVSGYLISKKLVSCPPCLSPDKSLCGPCPMGKITLASVPNPNSTDILNIDVSSLDLKIQNIVQKLELNYIYEFTIKPGQNYPELVSVNNLELNTQIKNDVLVERKTYTIKELNTNTSTITRNFFTEAYVIQVTLAVRTQKSPSSDSIINKVFISDDKSYEVKYPQCEIGSPCPPFLTDKQVELILVDKGYSRDFFELKKKYRLEIRVRNISKTEVSQNEFTLVSVKDIKGGVVATSTPPVGGDQPVKKFFVTRFINWFLGIFGKK